MKPTVYVPHLPTRHDPLTGRNVPTINLQPAARIGELLVINDKPSDAHEAGFRFAVERLKSCIKDFSADDYILMCGDTVLCAMAIHFAMATQPSVKILRWNRDARNYDLLITPTQGEAK